MKKSTKAGKRIDTKDVERSIEEAKHDIYVDLLIRKLY